MGTERKLDLRLPESLTVKVIGLGGIGSIVADHVALWLNCLSAQHGQTRFRLVLIDGDAFEPANGRVFFSRCGNKAQVKRDDLLDRIGDRLQRLGVEAIDQYVTPDNVGRLILERDHVLLCVDRHASRKLVSDHFAGNMKDGVLISAGNDGVGPDGAGRNLRGSYGNCQVFIRRHGEDASPSLTRFHPEIAQPGDRLPTDASCTDLVESVPQLLVANFWAAASILASLYLCLCDHRAPDYSELAFDFAEGLMRPINVPAPRMSG